MRNILIPTDEALTLLNELRARDGMPPVGELYSFVARKTLEVAQKKYGVNFFRKTNIMALHASHLIRVRDSGGTVGRPRKKKDGDDG